MSPHAPVFRAAQASYADLFFKLLDPAFLLDPETLQILEMNDAAEDAFGFSTKRARTTNMIDWIAASDREEFLKQTRIARRRYHPRTHEVRIRGSDGKTRLFRVDLCQLRADQENREAEILQLIAHDITAQREAEERAENYLRDLESANERLRQMTITDEMTGCHNYRHFKQRLQAEHQRAVRFKRSYAILFFDLDHFKHYNDRNGHQAGDELLARMGQLLRDSSRETDCIARYGGEEFVILAPEATATKALEFAERLRKQIADFPFANADTQPLGRVSASIGVASFSESGATPEQVLKAADEAMYTSKRSGRNQVSMAPPASGAPPLPPPRGC